MPDATLLARIQFAANITFHILFPTITIALAWVLLFFKLRFNAHARRQSWHGGLPLLGQGVRADLRAGRGLAASPCRFQFGTNWPGYMETVGNIAGPLLAYEVLTAFFLEATFLGIMLFGLQRVSDRRAHAGHACWWPSAPRCRRSGSWR